MQKKFSAKRKLVRTENSGGTYSDLQTRGKRQRKGKIKSDLRQWQRHRKGDRKYS